MSNKYKHGEKVPSSALIDRLNELSNAVTKGRDSINREFTMRVPAELDRDADLVLSSAASLIGELEQQNEALIAQVEELRDRLGRELAAVKEMHRINLENKNEKETAHWAGRIEALRFALGFLDYPASQSLSSIKSKVEEETIERCAETVYKEFPNVMGVANWIILKFPRKYQPTEE
jgi:hypothetical protein